MGDSEKGGTVTYLGSLAIGLVVHGAAREAMGYVRGVLSTEINSATDNPLVFPEAGMIVSGGNFHAQVVSAALDFLAVAMADLASIDLRRPARLPNFLAKPTTTC